MKGHLGQRWESRLGLGATLRSLGVVNEVGAVSVDESTEGQPILPAGQREEGVRPGFMASRALPYPGPRPSIWMASSVKWSQVLIPCLAFKARFTSHGPFPPSSS